MSASTGGASDLRMMKAIRWNFLRGFGSDRDMKWKSGIVDASSSS